MSWVSKPEGGPSAGDVAIRAIVLKYVVVYGLAAPPREALERAMAEASEAERVKVENDVRENRDAHWNQLGYLRKYLSPSEEEFADTTAVSMDHQQQVNATWRAEGLVVMLWALNIVNELPPYDTQVSADLYADFAPSDPKSFVKNATLRNKGIIERERTRAELWHWRSRTRELIEEGRPFRNDPQMMAAGFKSYDDIVRLTAKHAASDGTISSVFDEDFGACGKAFRDLTFKEWSGVRSITTERHFALNWLCGYAPENRWDETPTDT